MRIACPHCSAVYAVPDAALAGAPRLFRCARCAFQWMPPTPVPPPARASRPAALPAPRDAAAGDAAPLAVMEIPPRPAMPPRLERSAPLLEDNRSARPRLLGPAPLGVAAFGMTPLDVDARGAGTGDTGTRSLGTVAGIVGWALTVAVVVAAIALFLLRQPQIETLWPPSQRLYAVLGLH